MDGRTDGPTDGRTDGPTDRQLGFKSCSGQLKIDGLIVIKNFLNPKGHQNCVSGSKDMAILLKGLILPIGGASAVEGL